MLSVLKSNSSLQINQDSYEKDKKKSEIHFTLELYLKGVFSVKNSVHNQWNQRTKHISKMIK